MPSEELLFQDGLGDRVLLRDADGLPVHESLLVRTALSSVPSFEFALNQRLTALARFEHPSFTRVRRLERSHERLPRLALIADPAAGVRLSELLAAMEPAGAARPLGASLFLVREILDAIVVFHQTTDASHGALAPERILIVDGRVRIADYVLGTAIEQLRFSPERYWKELRVAVPGSAGAPRFDRRLDVAQVGTIALALFAGRQLRDDEHMGNLGGVLASLDVPPQIRTWLMKALHMDPRAFVGALEALRGLEETMEESGVRPSPLELQALKLRPGRVNAGAAPTRSVPKAPAPPAVSAARKPQPRAAAQPRPVETGTLASAPPQPRSRAWMMLGYAVLAAMIGGAFAAARYVPAPAALFSDNGTLVIDSDPSGVELLVDGQPQGITPATVTVASGRHEVELRGAGRSRVLSIDVEPGARVSQRVVLRPTR